MHSCVACRGRWTTRGSDLQPPCSHRPDFTWWVEKSRQTRGHYLSKNNTRLQWAQVGRETCQWVQRPGRQSCSGRAGREQGSGGPSAWSPAAGLGQGQREPLGTGERSCWDQRGWCRSMQQNPPRPECGTVLGSGLRRRPAFRRAGGCRGMSSCS